MPSSLSLAKRGASSSLASFFMRSKSSASTVTFWILTVLSLSPVAALAGMTATTSLSTKPELPSGAALA